MATWTIQQKAEIWYECEVEADTLDEAIELADDSDDWWQKSDTTEFCDEYWAENQDTDEQFTRLPSGNVIKGA